MVVVVVVAMKFLKLSFLALRQFFMVFILVMIILTRVEVLITLKLVMNEGEEFVGGYF